MSKKLDDAEFLKEKILASGVSKKVLNKLYKEKQSDSGISKRYSKVSDATIYQNILGDLGISLISQPTVSTSAKSDFQKYLEYRESTRETCLYVWESLKPKIYDLINKVEKVEIEEKLSKAQTDSDQSRIDYFRKNEYKNDVQEFLDEKTTTTEFIYPELIKATNLLENQYVASLLIHDDDWKNPKDYDELYNLDAGLFDAVPKIVKEIFHTIYRAFLQIGHSKYESFPRSSNTFQPHKSFEQENIRLRYPNGRVNPYRAPTRPPPYNQWYHDRAAPDEFLQCFSGIVSFIDSLRNFEAHKEDGDTKQRFNLADRYIKDPLTNMSSPGNFVVLANNSINFLYEFIEIIQIWLDSKKIEKKALSGRIPT